MCSHDLGHATVEEMVRAISEGTFVVLVGPGADDGHGHLVLATDAATPKKLGFMMRYTSGIICQTLSDRRLRELRLPRLFDDEQGLDRIAFTVPVDSKHGTSTGISAEDRVRTIEALLDPTTQPSDLVWPGHVYPIAARDGGLLERVGHTEAVLDLTRLAGRTPSGVLAEVVNDDGSLATMSQLRDFAHGHEIILGTIYDLLLFRQRNTTLIEEQVEARLPTKAGMYRVFGFSSIVEEREFIALVMGEVSGKSDVPVVIHSECLLGDALGSEACNCGRSLSDGMHAIAQTGRGVVVYVRAKEDGPHDFHKREDGEDATRLDGVTEESVLQILRHLGIESIHAIATNGPMVWGRIEYSFSDWSGEGSSPLRRASRVGDAKC